jgi:glutamate/tyrosine decarboxylase-like PLP-dependent enzyme
MLQLDPEDRERLWSRLMERVERYAAQIDTLPVSPELDPAKIRADLARLDFTQPVSCEAAVDYAADALTKWQVHTPHPMYFGLFNPAPTTMGIAADTLVAAFNPQLAAWSHSPFAVEAERYVIETFAAKFGLPQENVEGTFTSGGMEANHTALLTALVHQFPSYLERGARGIDKQPVMYVSSESHHSLLKAARLCGIGSEAVHRIDADEHLRMRSDLLRASIAEDRRRNNAPFLIAATAGATNTGVVDDLAAIGQVAADENLWYHIDAAWGGAAVFVPEMRSELQGIELADSITFDAHKWLSVPMGAGIYMTRHPIMDATFRVQTAYMPKDAESLDIVDPHLTSMQWSRRFMGLKVLLSLMVAGWDGYASAIRHQTAMGAALRIRLTERGWTIRNQTKLPVVCFTRDSLTNDQLFRICARIVDSGEAWLSTTLLAGKEMVLRACITNYRTDTEHVDRLVDAVGDAWEAER